jgi:hypothetical protein
LPGFFSHLREFVDGFVAFDDCSTDKSFAIAEAEPKMVRLLQRQTPSADHHFEVQNRLALLTAARESGAQWLLCSDADERYETRFLQNLRSLVEAPPAPVIGLPFVALWENFKQHRIGKARKYVLFPSTNPLPYYPHGLLHQQWYPPCLEGSKKLLLDFNIYHLGSLTRGDRQARFEKFNRIDPDLRHQPQGYKNLIDESDLMVAPITADRSFRYE